MATNETLRESKIDWITIGLYFIIVLLGWLNLYSTSKDEATSLLNFSTYHGKEAFFILASFVLGILIMFLDTKFLEFLSYFFYGFCILLLLAVLLVVSVNGASSWFEIGGVKIQPTELAKVATLMALAKFMSRFNFSLKNRNDLLIAVGIVALPIVLVLAQNDAGSALVFMGLVIVFYREGLHPLVLIGGILLVAVAAISLLFSTTHALPFYIAPFVVIIIAYSFVSIFRWRFLMFHLAALVFLIAIPFGVTKVVKPYQSARFRVLVAPDPKITNPEEELAKQEAFAKMTPEQKRKRVEEKKIEDDGKRELKKVHYNYLHSLVAVGSGGVLGKGFGNSTHTRGDFVPEEHTDYIHCVWSEEHGFVGSSILLILFFSLVARIFYVAENSKSDYARVYGYGVGAILMIHVIVNIGMSIGVVPTIGIPLPFFSYGGSSMLSFSMMIFILINNYSYRTNVLASSAGRA